MKPLTVAILCNYPTYRFTEELGLDRNAIRRVTTWNDSLIEAMSGIDGLRMHVITACAEINSPRTVNRDNLRVTYLDMPRWKNAFTLFQYTRYRAARLLEKIQPDLVHGIGTEHIWPYVATHYGLPCVVTIHGVMTSIVKKHPPRLLSKRRLFAFYEPRVVRRAGHLIAINPYIVESLGKYIHGQVHNIENPINNCYFKQASNPPDNTSVVFVGGIEPLKGLHILVEAAGILKQEYSLSFPLHIVGPTLDKEYETGVRKQLERYGLADKARFHGFIFPDQLAEIYGNAALLAVPSFEESFSMCSAEAMACGIPVVASRVGGIPNVVRDGESGTLVEPGDARGLAEAIRRFLEDPQRRKTYGEQGRQIAEKRWRPTVIAAQTVDVYRQAASAENRSTES
jgi:glycosyltransferase involved in cell wall biosynthesis